MRAEFECKAPEGGSDEIGTDLARHTSQKCQKGSRDIHNFNLRPTKTKKCPAGLAIK